MLKYIFPALKQSADTKNHKIGKLYVCGYAFIIFVLSPLIAIELSKRVDINPIISISFYFIYMAMSYTINCFFPTILVSIFDAVFYKNHFSLLQITRTLFSARVVFIFLEILLNTMFPVSLSILAQMLANVWYIINMYIALRKGLGYTLLKTMIPTILYGFIVIAPLIIFSW